MKMMMEEEEEGKGRWVCAEAAIRRPHHVSGIKTLRAAAAELASWLPLGEQTGSTTLAACHKLFSAG